MTEHERIWLEPAGAPDRCWCQDNQWGDEGVEYVLASTLDVARAEENRLRTIALDMQAGYREALARAEEAEAEVKRYRVALIAAKTRMRNCRGAIESNQVVDKDVHGSLQNGIRDIQDALANTGGEHNAE